MSIDSNDLDVLAATLSPLSDEQLERLAFAIEAITQLRAFERHRIGICGSDCALCLEAAA